MNNRDILAGILAVTVLAFGIENAVARDLHVDAARYLGVESDGFDALGRKVLPGERCTKDDSTGAGTAHPAQ